jgi:hypothetical protein
VRHSLLKKGLLVLGLIAVQGVVVSGVAEAAPKAKPVNDKRAQKPKATKAKAEAAKPAEAAEASAPGDATKSLETKTEPAAPAAEPAAEGTVQAAGTKVPAQRPPKGAVKEHEGPEGVKTYQFSAIEVEGRLTSPQILYFLRRVRAEFDAGGLGHRSFLGELRDTRNTAVFR